MIAYNLAIVNPLPDGGRGKRERYAVGPQDGDRITYFGTNTMNPLDLIFTILASSSVGLQDKENVRVPPFENILQDCYIDGKQ